MKTSPEPFETLPATAPPRRYAIAPVRIPAVRDRLQSELLVWGWLAAVLPLTLLLVWVRGVLDWQSGQFFTGTAMQGVYASLLLTALVLALRAATPAAAAVGFIVSVNTTMVALLSTSHLNETALPTLLTLFVLTFAATRLGRSRKAALGLAESRSGRAANQIVANLGMAAALAMLHGCSGGIEPACIAVFAEATADTVSSELGPLFSGRTFLLTTMQPVEPGTDGGISLAGSFCGIAAAAIVVTVGVLTMHLIWLDAVVAFPAAVIGFFADSLLGATLERRGLIGNDWVNFLSTAVTAVIVLPFGGLLLG